VLLLENLHPEVHHQRRIALQTRSRTLHLIIRKYPVTQHNVVSASRTPNPSLIPENEKFENGCQTGPPQTCFSTRKPAPTPMPVVFPRPAERNSSQPVPMAPSLVKTTVAEQQATSRNAASPSPTSQSPAQALVPKDVRDRTRSGVSSRGSILSHQTYSPQL
jgi:hypothetical protein